MSLIHWWPLNGNLNDKGTSNIPLTNNGATVNSSGKIGSCYSFSGNNMVVSTSDITSATALSLCLWLKLSTSHSGYAQVLVLGTSGTSWNNIRCGIDINGDGKVYFNTSNGSANTYIYSPSNYKDGVWHHIAGIYNDGSLQLYIDGTRVATGTTSNAPALSGTSIYVGGNDGGEKANNGDCLNDIRIYNHALSAKEVKEISKGLVLHYNFEDEYIEPTTNLGNTSSNYSNMNKGTAYSAYAWGGDAGTVTFYDSGGYNNYPYKVYHKTATGSGGIYYKTANDITIEAGKTYTMSVYIKASVNIKSASAYSFNINRDSDNFYINYGTSFNITTEWQRLIKTFTATSSEAGSYGEMSIIYDDTPTDYYIYYSGFQIEEKDHATPYANGTRSGEKAYDSSGYGNNGTIFGDLQITSDSASGRYSAVFNGSDTAIQTPNLATLITDGIYTINLWFNVPELGSKPWGTFYGGPSGYEFSSRRGSTPTIVAYSWGQNSSGGYEYNLNTWYMLTVVRTTSDSKWYINGELYYTGTAGSIPSGNYFIGAWSNATLQNFNGKISDFKIFATALSADDVKAEYNRKAAIDKNGNLFTGEIIENGKSQELMWTAKADWGISYRQSGSDDRITVDSDGSVVFTKMVWAKSPMIPVKAGETLYYDITYSNTSGNLFYLGYEFYNASGGSDQNEGCNYVIGSTNSADHSRIKGTITVPTQAASAATTQLRLRILNDWNGTGNASYIAKIHHISLRRVSSIDAPKIDKNNYIIASDIREYNYTNKTSLYKNGFMAANKIEEL